MLELDELEELESILDTYERSILNTFQEGVVRHGTEDIIVGVQDDDLDDNKAMFLSIPRLEALVEDSCPKEILPQIQNPPEEVPGHNTFWCFIVLGEVYYCGPISIKREECLRTLI